MSDGESSESTYDPASLEGVPEAGRARLQQNRGGLFTSRSIGQRVPAGQAGGLRPGGAGGGELDLPHRLQVAGWKQKPGADGALRSNVRARASSR